MSTDVGICNLALSLLGDGAQVTALDGSDASAQAGWCRTFYPIARDNLLARHAWRFAIAKATLSTAATAADGWTYAYTAPADCLKPLNLTPAASSLQQTASIGYRWDPTAGILYCNTAAPVLQYVRQLTDATLYPAYFVSVLARLLASYLAGSLIKGAEGIKVSESHTSLLQGELEQAIATDAAAGQREEAGTAEAVLSMALSHLAPWLGAVSLNPLDGSPAAQRATQFYPIARDQALQAHPWDFATRRATLAQTVGGGGIDGFAYCYDLPADLLRALIVFRPGAVDDVHGVNFRVELDATGTRRLWCSEPEALCKYIAKITDPAKWSQPFTLALSYLLAGYLAEALVPPKMNPAGVAQAMSQRFVGQLGGAAALDARGQREVPVHLPEWLARR